MNNPETLLMNDTPTIFAEIVFCFNYDFRIEILNTILCMEPWDARRKSATRINPITHQPNPGYWKHRTQMFHSFDCEPLLTLLYNYFITNTEQISSVVRDFHPSDFIIRIMIKPDSKGAYPALQISPQFLLLLSSYNSMLDIVIDD